MAKRRRWRGGGSRGGGRRRGRPVRPGEGRRREVGDAPDRWVPPVSERERERRGGGRASGLLWAESGGPTVEKKKREKGGKDGLGQCCGFGFVVFFSFSFFYFSFSNPFLNQFQTFLNSNLFRVFKFKF
jgi:hypothetical protein